MLIITIPLALPIRINVPKTKMLFNSGLLNTEVFGLIKR
jgi:hypothetical protein